MCWFPKPDPVAHVCVCVCMRLCKCVSTFFYLPTFFPLLYLHVAFLLIAPVFALIICFLQAFPLIKSVRYVLEWEQRQC